MKLVLQLLPLGSPWYKLIGKLSGLLDSYSLELIAKLVKYNGTLKVAIAVA